MNPDSFEDLSCQVRLIWPDDAAVATRSVGASGVLGLAAWRGAVKNRFNRAIKASIGTEPTAPRSAGRCGWMHRFIMGGSRSEISDKGRFTAETTRCFCTVGGWRNVWCAFRSSSITNMSGCLVIGFGSVSVFFLFQVGRLILANQTTAQQGVGKWRANLRILLLRSRQTPFRWFLKGMGGRYSLYLLRQVFHPCVWSLDTVWSRPTKRVAEGATSTQVQPRVGQVRG